MKLQLTFLLATFASAFAVEKPEGWTPDQLRKQVQRRRAEDSSDDPSSDEESDDDKACFSASNSVEVKGEGMVSMDSLKIGDYVRSGKDGEYSRVLSFIHYAPDEEGNFIKIHSEGNAPLELTSNHLVYRNDKAIKAEDVAVGDMLGDSKVTEITYSKKTGLYAPVTFDGSIVVNGVKASNYVAFLDHIPIDQHQFCHMFFALQRAACSVNFGLCERETYTNGISAYANFFIQFYAYTNTFSGPFAWFVEKVFCYIVGPMWMTIEQMVISPIFGLLSIGFLIYRSLPKKSKMA